MAYWSQDWAFLPQRRIQLIPVFALDLLLTIPLLNEGRRSTALFCLLFRLLHSGPAALKFAKWSISCYVRFYFSMVLLCNSFILVNSPSPKVFFPQPVGLSYNPLHLGGTGMPSVVLPLLARPVSPKTTTFYPPTQRHLDRFSSFLFDTFALFSL